MLYAFSRVMQKDEALRLKALQDYRVLDTPPEAVFDNLTRLAADLLQTPIALVSLVDAERQWFKARVGLPATETPRTVSFCDHAIRADSNLVVEDATKDPRFAENPLVLGDPSIRFYCGVVLRSPDGHGLGTLCVIDRVPRVLTRGEEGVLEALARQVEGELEVRRRLALLEESLGAQQERQHEKELLAAMLVHDLRGPLTAISLLAASVTPTDEESRQGLEELQLESDRARRMLSDVLDICLDQMGGLRLRRAPVVLGRLIADHVRRMQRRAHTLNVELQLTLPEESIALDVDPELVGRMIDNLIQNALDHGPRKPVGVIVRRDRDKVRVEVRDRGPTLSADLQRRLFRPFESGSQRGHGLGLAFCRLAAEAHGGVVGVEGWENGNCFFVELPA